MKDLGEVQRRRRADPEDWGAVAAWAREALRNRSPEDFPCPGPVGSPAEFFEGLLVLGLFPGEAYGELAWSSKHGRFCLLLRRERLTWIDSVNVRVTGLKDVLRQHGSAAPIRLIEWGLSSDQMYSAIALSPENQTPLTCGSLRDRLMTLSDVVRNMLVFEHSDVLWPAIWPSDFRRDEDGLVFIGQHNRFWNMDRLGCLTIAGRLPPIDEIRRLAPDLIVDPYRFVAGSYVYLFGTLLFEIAAGRLPFLGPNLKRNFELQQRGEWNPQGLPDRFEPICKRALAFRPEDRHRTLTEFCEELEVALGL